MERGREVTFTIISLKAMHPLLGLLKILPWKQDLGPGASPKGIEPNPSESNTLDLSFFWYTGLTEVCM